MRTHLLGLISICALLALSCSDEAKERVADGEGWTPSLSKGEKLLRVVHLSPGEVLPVEGVVESEGMYGIRVKEAWDIKDREDADGGDYWVYLRSSSSTPDRPNSVGTTFGAASKFHPGEGIKYELANETPIPVTVAIYTVNWMQKPQTLSFALFWVMLITPSIAEDQSSLARIENDPKTIAEFSQIVQDAARKGAVRVQFPSGEWNWYSTFQLDLPKKERFAEWSSSSTPVKQDDLRKWLSENKISAVQISMAKNCDPTVFFEIEAILRKHKIVYWVQSADATATQKELIRLLETDGVTISIPAGERHPDK